MHNRDQRLDQARKVVARGDHAVAYAIYEELLQERPDDPRVLYDYGRAKYHEYADLEQAARLFERALVAEPAAVDPLLWLADLAALGYGPGYRVAADLYRRAIEIDPQTVDAYIGLGMLHRAPVPILGLDQAIAAFRQAIQLDPQRADAHLDLGMALLESGNRQAARAELRAGERLLLAGGAHRQAQGVRALLERVERNEPITSTVYTLSSPRYRWPE